MFVSYTNPALLRMEGKPNCKTRMEAWKHGLAVSGSHGI